MYRSAWTRIAVILAFGLVAYYSTPYAGWMWGVDAWLWTGVRDLIHGPNVRYVPLALAGILVVADLAGALCPSCAVPVRRPIRWAIFIAIAGGVLLWRLRVLRWLGDFADVDHQDIQHWTIESAEPLGAFTTYYIWQWAIALKIKVSTAVAFVDTLFGAGALAALFLWARTLTAEWPLPFAMLASSGFMILFYGYPEKGTPKALALLFWYAYLTTRYHRERRTAQQALSSLALALAVLMHGSATCWLPAHVWYVWRPASWRHRLVGLAAFLAPMAAVLVYVFTGARIAGAPWGNIAAPWQWFKAYCISNCGYDFVSTTHALDALNCALALAPVAMLCYPEALARAGDDTARWLALGTLGCVFLSATWFPVLGYYADWDIFAITPFAISLLAAYVAAAQMSPRAFRRLAFVWIVGNALHTYSWWRYFRVPL